MSFKSGAKFLSDYRTGRAKALNNTAVQKWSTSSSKSIKEFVKTFNTEDTTVAWRKLYDQMLKANLNTPGQLQALRLTSNFLAGCRRDVRIQYGAGSDDRPRFGLDFNRYEYSRLAYNNYILDVLDKRIDSLLKT